MIELNARSVIDPALLDDPYPFYDLLRREHPVWNVPGIPLAYVASSEHVIEAVRRIDDFSNHLDAMVVTGDDGSPTLFRTNEMGEGTMTLATADPPDHTRHRNLVFPELVSRQMANMAPLVARISAEHMAAAQSRGPAVEWAEAVANPIPARVIAHVIGLPDEDWPDVMRWAMEGTGLLAGVHDLAAMAAYGERAGEAGTYLATKLIDAAEAPREDLLGTCARAVTDGELDMAEAVGTLVILLGAGGESTAALIGNAVRLLAQDPVLQETVRADRRTVGPLLEEALRLESPFKGHFRQVRRDCELGGTPLAAGTTALLLWAAANRDPVEYERPDEVVLDRRLGRNHLAFGRGIHHCVGAALARMEAATALDTLLDNSTAFSLVDGDPPEWEPSLFVRRHRRLPLRVAWR